MKPDKVLSMLGLAAKAGKVVSGEFSTEKAIKARKAYIVMVAEDASDNTKRHSEIHVITTGYRLQSMLPRKLWDIVSESRCEHRWQFWTRDLVRRL